jgi:crossover junction endodeoxyribonuclease RuvC
MRVLGIDPGLHGALALIDTDFDDVLVVRDMPIAKTTVRHELVAPWLSDIVRELEPHEVYLERVHALPRQGVSSSFSFGMTYGTTRGVLAALKLPTHLVTPNEWKRALRLGADKSAARAMAANLFAREANLFARVKDDGRAEAALLAYFGRHARGRATPPAIPGRLSGKPGVVP